MTLPVIFLAVLLGFLLDGSSADPADLSSVMLVLLAVRSLLLIAERVSAPRESSFRLQDSGLALMLSLYLLLRLQPAEWSADAWTHLLFTLVMWAGLAQAAQLLPARKHQHSQTHRKRNNQTTSHSESSHRSSSHRKHRESQPSRRASDNTLPEND